MSSFRRETVDNMPSDAINPANKVRESSIPDPKPPKDWEWSTRP
jgi:hypothetical protein